MGDEDEEVDPPQDARSAVSGRFRQSVIGDVGDEKQRCRRESGEDEAPVQLDVFFQDEVQCGKQKHEGEAIEYRIQHRQQINIEADLAIIPGQEKQYGHQGVDADRQRDDQRTVIALLARLRSVAFVCC